MRLKIKKIAIKEGVTEKALPATEAGCQGGGVLLFFGLLLPLLLFKPFCNLYAAAV